MTPSPEQIRLAALNHCRLPARTHGAKIRDAVRHANQSSIKKPAKQLACDGLGIRDENITTPDPYPHPNL